MQALPGHEGTGGRHGPRFKMDGWMGKKKHIHYECVKKA